MSVRLMAEVWATSTAKGTARLVMLALADEASDEGEVTAYRRSLSHLARKCNVSPDSVRRAIDQLTAAGELEVLRPGGGRRQSDYQLHLPGNPQPKVERMQSATPGVAPVHTQGVQSATPGVAPVHTPSSRSSPPLPGMTPRAPSPGAAPLDALHVQADAVARAVWDGKDPKPATPFVAARKIARQLLGAGWSADEVTAAMVAAPHLSTGWIEAELARRRPARARAADQRLDTDRGGHAGRVEGL